MRRPWLAAGLFAAALACRQGSREPEAPPPGEVWLTDAQIAGARLSIEPAGSRALVLHRITAGRVAFDEGRVAHVFSPVSGRVTRVLGELGASVSAGSPLAIIESPDLASAWSDLAKARADRVAAARDLERQKGLFERHAAAQRDYEAAQSAAEKADAEEARARLRLSLLHAPEDSGPTQQYALRAPIAGEIVNRTATPGLEVQGMLASANVVQELFTVGRLDRVWVWGDVYEPDLGRVRRGQTVAITSVAYPDRRIGGTVDYVGEVLDPQTHTAKIRCVVENADRLLKPEMYVTLSIDLGTIDALALPRSAVVKTGDRWVVYVRDGKTPDGRTRFRERRVEPGDADDGWIRIVSGVAPGESVVVSGSILLSGESG